MMLVGRRCTYIGILDMSKECWCRTTMFSRSQDRSLSTDMVAETDYSLNNEGVEC